MTEKIATVVFDNSAQASVHVARRIAELLRTKAAQKQNAVLGLATGHTPVGVYQELIRMHREDGLDFSNVVTFNLDEYYPMAPDAPQSYHRWMHEHLFSQVNIPAENIHIPCGTVSENELEGYCRDYEQAIRAAGGIDLQLLGIGRSGHVGFNEPGSARDSRTRKVYLDRITKMDAASDFFGPENVPDTAITMGVGSILDAREIALLAFGEHKAPIVRRAVEGEVSHSVVASFLQEHPNTTFYLDRPAAAELPRIATPWLAGHCDWDEALQRRAVIRLATHLNKPILKLTDEDYAENGLHELLRQRGRAYDQNITVFRHMMNTITGWPAGKGEKRHILILSPHPDDDVICMGGTMTRLAQQGHEIHVAYMVSGCLSVFDHDVIRYADFVREFNAIFGLTPEQTRKTEQRIDALLRNKTPGQPDAPEIQALKGRIRRGEAIDAAGYCGIAEKNLHFLDLPFYNTGKVQKLSIGAEDIALVRELYENVQPELIFAAGDLSDPHGTHRLCLQAALEALKQYQATPQVWLYRGAWQEWAPESIDMAVPLSPDELIHKRYAIFRHQSQKDRAMFPGPYDSREFWQRAEDRNKTSAEIYDKLGLPEYHALEAFVRLEHLHY